MTGTQTMNPLNLTKHPLERRSPLFVFINIMDVITFFSRIVRDSLSYLNWTPLSSYRIALTVLVKFFMFGNQAFFTKSWHWHNACIWKKHDITNHTTIERGLIVLFFIAGCIHGTTCLSETMTKGRGRQGHKWSSPPRGNIYMTIVLRINPGQEVSLFWGPRGFWYLNIDPPSLIP
jgi:hypothetical protein